MSRRVKITMQGLAQLSPDSMTHDPTVGDGADRQVAMLVLGARLQAAAGNGHAAVTALRSAAAMSSGARLRQATGQLAVAVSRQLIWSGPGDTAVPTTPGLEAAEIAVTVLPESESAWHAYAVALDSVGRATDARSAHDRAFALNPNSSAVRVSSKTVHSDLSADADPPIGRDWSTATGAKLAGDGGGRKLRVRTSVAVLAAFCICILLATMPLTLRALNVHIQLPAVKPNNGSSPLSAPSKLRPVTLPPVARPVNPDDRAAMPPNVNPVREANLASSEDARIKVLQLVADHTRQPKVIPIHGSLPTLILPARPKPYTASDLERYGALAMAKHHIGLLADNIFVSANATLELIAPQLQRLSMDSSTDGFASIVTWGGDLVFAGTRTIPLTVIGWDRVTNSLAVDHGYGRSYIRAVAGSMTLSDVRVSALGFGSGPSGGVSWTGVSGTPSTGSATHSTFTDSTYGAFVDRGQDIRFSADSFEFNQLDGLHIHTHSVGILVVLSSATRNGASGFSIGRATRNTLLWGDVAENNGTDGFLVDSRPLINNPNAVDNTSEPTSGASIYSSAAIDNARIGVLVEGGSGTALSGDEICSQGVGIAARSGATNLVITGNDIRCRPRSGLSIGPDDPGTMISGNAVSGARIALLIYNSGSIDVDNNLITGATEFGISVRGVSSIVHGVGNTIAGTGYRAIDTRANTPGFFRHNNHRLAAP